MNRLLEKSIIDHAIGFHYAFTQPTPSEPHNHDFYEFFITYENDLYHIVNGEKMRLPVGSLVLIRPNDSHSFEQTTAGNSFILNIAFTGSTFQALMNYLNNEALIHWLDTNKMPLTLQLQAFELKTIKASFEILALSANPDRSQLFLAFKSLLMEIFVDYFIKGILTDNSSIPQWLREFNEKMQHKEHFTAKLAECIELSGKSQEYLNRSIKKYYGVSTTEWLNGFKIQYAAGLLKYTDEAITEVAFDSGFENLSHFYHVFKRFFFISPAQYRKTNQKLVVPE